MDKLLEEYKTQKRLLVEALVEKEHMQTYESYVLKNDFVLKLGEPRYELHKLELTIARAKLKLDMMQACIKFKVPIDTDNIDRQLEKEFEKHNNVLRNMKKEIDSVHNTNDEEDKKIQNMQELKELYFSIAFYIHPELVDTTDKNIKRVWKATKKAYENGDIDKLKRLQKKVQNEFKDAALKIESQDIDLENTVLSMRTKRKMIVSEIESLKRQFPFTEEKILKDEEAVNKFKKEIDLDIKLASEVLDKLEKQILEKLPAPSKYIN
ncbi:hypothetical protein EHE19_012050 [Ruminiclostridium herbifermentans]|uniref:Uncharacterized protein n=1 Tax=Ruminiclostridium herbifermentans TaxID=2488810 RepID=A0A4U7JCS2_9FIRM|nr:hypothetical protein [Ruminiclostridium herbifermentans]QNU65654.1 hypothetical protein EHE19_012050 [Ruminiclostridium herbifermentans]